MGCRCSVYAATNDDALTTKRNAKDKEEQEGRDGLLRFSVASSRHVGEFCLSSRRAHALCRVLAHSSPTRHDATFLRFSLPLSVSLYSVERSTDRGRGKKEKGPPTVHTVRDRRRRPLLCKPSPRRQSLGHSRGKSHGLCKLKRVRLSRCLSLSLAL